MGTAARYPETRARARLGKTFCPSAQLATHVHDDYGLANANIIAAVMAECEVIDLSINGMGARGGLADTCIVVPNLETLSK